MDVLIHKDFLGMERNAIISNSMLMWTVDDNTDFVYGNINDTRSIEPLLRLLELTVPDLVPEKFKLAMRICGSSHPPWKSIVPKSIYKSRLKSLIVSLDKHAKHLRAFEYCKTFMQSQKLFSYLQSSTLDVPRCKEILENEDNRIIENILKMSKGNRCIPPRYDRVSTKTGRLVIKSGPQVLTLKKEYRDIFRPSHPRASLYEVDFSSLEPRVASNLANRNPGPDVYLSFMEHCDINISRDAAKLAVLCSLYGAGKYNLQRQLDAQSAGVTADFLIKKVREYFSINNLQSNLKKQFKDSGKISNYFGRPIYIDDYRDSVLINNYLQSTAVDVALLGFEKICRDLSTKIRPLFVIHDALFFEINDNYLVDVREYLSKGISLEGLGSFPLKISKFKEHG